MLKNKFMRDRLMIDRNVKKEYVLDVALTIIDYQDFHRRFLKEHDPKNLIYCKFLLSSYTIFFSVSWFLPKQQSRGTQISIVSTT
jgi:hypothetical protein